MVGGIWSTSPVRLPIIPSRQVVRSLFLLSSVHGAAPVRPDKLCVATPAARVATDVADQAPHVPPPLLARQPVDPPERHQVAGLKVRRVERSGFQAVGHQVLLLSST